MAASAKRANRKERREQKKRQNNPIRPLPKYEIHPLKALNQAQSIMLSSLDDDTLIVAKGSAGTGKTALACSYAAEQLHKRQVEKIIVARPTIALDDDDSPFLPGTEEEKIGPWLRPVLKSLEDVLGKGAVDCQLKAGNIELRALDYIRGCSFDNTILIIDEAQQLTMGQLKAITTRIGVGSKIILCGDTRQVDREFEGGVPLDIFCEMLSQYNIPDYSVITFTHADIVRSDFCRDMVVMFETAGY